MSWFSRFFKMFRNHEGELERKIVDENISYLLDRDGHKVIFFETFKDYYSIYWYTSQSRFYDFLQASAESFDQIKNINEKSELLKIEKKFSTGIILQKTNGEQIYEPSYYPYIKKLRIERLIKEGVKCIRFNSEFFDTWYDIIPGIDGNLYCGIISHLNIPEAIRHLYFSTSKSRISKKVLLKEFEKNLFIYPLKKEA